MLDEEDAEGEPDHSYSGEESDEDEDEGMSEIDESTGAFRQEKGKEKDLGEAEEAEEVDQDFEYVLKLLCSVGILSTMAVGLSMIYAAVTLRQEL